METQSALRWPRDLFRSPDGVDQACPEQFDVTGAPHMLFFGPYQTLAAGTWELTLDLTFDDEAARRIYLAEFGCGEDVSRFWFRPGQAGRHNVPVTHVFAQESLAEARLWTARAAFHGSLQFHGAEVSPNVSP